VAAILASAPPQTAVPTADLELALRELDQFPNVFRHLVQIWVLKYDSRMVLMQDARGLSYIARVGVGLVSPSVVIPKTGHLNLRQPTSQSDLDEGECFVATCNCRWVCSWRTQQLRHKQLSLRAQVPAMS
jgi:hypothetical protein